MKVLIVLIILLNLFSFFVYAEDDLGGILDLLNSNLLEGQNNQWNDNNLQVEKDNSTQENNENTEKDILPQTPDNQKDALPEILDNQSDNLYSVEQLNKNNNVVPDQTSISNNQKNIVVHPSAQTVDNNVYNVIGYVKWDRVYVYYIPWNGIKKVDIYYSYDGKNFTKLIKLSAGKKYYSFPVDFNKKKIYIKVLPVDDNGNYWHMKEWTKEVPYIEISLVGKKVADKKVWHAKTWPELWLLFVISLIVAVLYRKRLS